MMRNTVPQTVSIIIPFYNEEENIFRCCESIHAAMGGTSFAWELVLVNDGSDDHTQQEMETCRKQYGPHIRIIELRRNFGQTAAMQAGIDAACGDIIVTLDGDLQNDPADIPGMVEQLIKDDLDLLVGWRKNRKDPLLLRKIPSRLANRLIGAITGIRLHDYGCSLKAYRASVIKHVRLYGEMHRFIPAWVAAVAPAHRISERVLRHYPRTAGKSKYGLSRTFRVLMDLLSVWFFMNFKARPGQFFGAIGLTFLISSSVVFTVLGYDKYILGQDIGARPLLLLGVVLIISAIQFFTIGLLAELLARIYFESSKKTSYALKTTETGKHRWKRHYSASSAIDQ